MKDVVLLNGWGMSAAVWQPLAGGLPPEWKLHAMDLHEIGRGCTGLAEFAATAAQRSPGRCDVVAWSLGAQVALQWAARHPGQVRRLVLIAATPRFVAGSDWPAGMDAAVFDAFAASLDADAQGTLHRFALLQARGDENAATIGRALRACVCAPAMAVDELRTGLRCLREGDLRPRLPQVRQPVCLVHGAKDGIVPVVAAEHLCECLADARLHVLTEASHAPHVSRPRQVAEAVADFLS